MVAGQHGIVQHLPGFGRPSLRRIDASQGVQVAEARILGQHVGLLSRLDLRIPDMPREQAQPREAVVIPGFGLA